VSYSRFKRVAHKSYFGHWAAAMWALSTEIDESRLKRVGSESEASSSCALDVEFASAS